MRKIKAFAAILLVFSMLICLPACGKGKTQTWVCNHDITKLVNNALMGESVELSIPEEAALYVPFELKLKDDGSCVIAINEASAKKYLDAYVPYLCEATVNQMYQLYSEMGIGKEEANVLVEHNMGMSIEEYAQQAMAEFVSYDVLYSDVEKYSYVYKRSGNEIYIALDKDSLETMKYSYIGTIDGDTLKLKLVNNIPDVFESFGIDTSMVFNKKK